MTFDQGLSLPEALHKQIVSASSHILMQLLKAFSHDSSIYIFNIGDLKNVFAVRNRL